VETGFQEVNKAKHNEIRGEGPNKSFLKTQKEGRETTSSNQSPIPLALILVGPPPITQYF